MNSRDYVSEISNVPSVRAVWNYFLLDISNHLTYIFGIIQGCYHGPEKHRAGLLVMNKINVKTKCFPL